MLLIDGDIERRSRLSHALLAAGAEVRAVGGIAEVERWPAGDVVITEGRRFTPFWKETGALHVVVLAESDEQGADACSRGASAWLPRQAPPHSVLDVLQGLGVLESAPARGDDLP